MLGFQENQSFLPRYAKELSIYAHCMWITETINKWMERMAVREVFSPLSGIICENVNWYSACEGNLDCLGKCQGILETSCCGNHVLHVHVVMPVTYTTIVSAVSLLNMITVSYLDCRQDFSLSCI